MHQERTVTESLTVPPAHEPGGNSRYSSTPKTPSSFTDASAATRPSKNPSRQASSSLNPRIPKRRAIKQWAAIVIDAGGRLRGYGTFDDRKNARTCLVNFKNDEQRQIEPEQLTYYIARAFHGKH